MKISPTEHRSTSWQLDAIASDFELEDAWRLPVTGGRNDFDQLLELFARLDPSHDEGSWASRLLFQLRDRLGRWFGWDAQTNCLPIPGCAECSLRDRLPAELRSPLGGSGSGLPFRPIFASDTEWAAELSNGTVHAALQLGWVAVSEERYEGRLGVYVKPRGLRGRIYMALIAPFRHFIVYPAMLRRIGRAWAAVQEQRGAGERAGHSTRAAEPGSG